MKYRIIDNLEDISEAELADIIATLPKWRQDAAMRYKHLSGRRESALAFHLLQQMMAEKYDIHDELFFDLNAHGKPTFHFHPEIHFNISHCKHAVACAVSDEPVGIDIECIGRYKVALAHYVLSAEELAELNVLSEAGKHELFTVLWTKKEALTKLRGTGITDDLKTLLHTNPTVLFHTDINSALQYVCTVATSPNLPEGEELRI